MKSNSKDFVSMEETQRYLKQMNTNFSFSREEIDPILTHSFQSPKSIIGEKPKKRSQTHKSFDIADQTQIKQEESQKKIIYKNRAIKRIIDNSEQILENNLRNVEEPIPSEQQSSQTRLNIYLKQFSRLSQNIKTRQSAQEEVNMTKNEKEQQNLQEVFKFSVRRSFKEKILVKTLPERIAQNNLQEVKNACVIKLCVLINETMRVHQDIDEKSQFQEIKLFQIINVDYHIHPEILMVLTIANDKSSGEKYMYLFFRSEQNQIKWDRALYCNFMHSNNMKKRKEKLFLHDYPVQQDDNIKSDSREHKNVGSKYHVNPHKVLKRVVEPDLEMTKMYEERKFTHSLSRERKDQYLERMSNDGFGASLKDSHLKKKQQPSSKNNEKIESSEQKFSPLKMTGSLMKPTSIFEKKSPHRMGETEKKEDGFRYQPKTYDERLNENSPKAKIAQTPQYRADGKVLYPDHYFLQEPHLTQTKQKKNPEISTPRSQVINPETRRKLELKKKYQNGGYLKKAKLFFDKHKKFYLLTDGFEYWDYEQKTEQKTERKVIKFSVINNYTIKLSQPSILIKYRKDKEITFLGEQETINDIGEWIELNKIMDNISQPKIQNKQ